MTWARVRGTRVLDFDQQFQGQLPAEKIRAAEGVPMWVEEVPRLMEAAPFQQVRITPAISQAVDAVMRETASRFPQASILLRQKLTIKGVPVFRCEYKVEQAQRVFFVYGIRSEVHAPNYPSVCPCCTIV